MTPSALYGKCQKLSHSTSSRDAPYGCYPHFSALGILNQILEDPEQILKMRLKALNNVLEDSEEDVDTDLAMCDGRR